MDTGIVKKVLDNKGTPEEVRETIKWLRTDEGKKYLSELMNEDFKAISSGKAEDWAECDVPEEEMKERFISEIRKSRRSRFRQYGIAASIIVPFLFLVGGLLFVCDRTGLLSPVTYNEVNVPSGETAKVILPDGTVVMMNSMSRMKYPSRFSLSERKVELDGEAYFNVSEDKSKPFSINLDILDITVLGTKFNVKAYDREPIRVTLEEGSVKLSDKRLLELVLKPGDHAEYDRKSGNCRITRPLDMEPVTAWKNSRQSFSMTPLNEVLKTLERHYGTHFSVKDSSILNDRYTLSFANKCDLETVLDDLQTVSRIRFRKTSTGEWEVYKEYTL
ncbi:MAG: FecR family protein [Candidatus Cryptobacteroides sp.]